ncbi:MAG TPA: hypothetical protein VFO19_04065 [Vicinamibacterales bacterium]|nr:hypothetical protein [Vicinamibacterales bacterium]
MTPGIGDVAALEDDVVDRPLGEEAARRQPGVAGADDDRGASLDGSVSGTIGRLRRLRR